MELISFKKRWDHMSRRGPDRANDMVRQWYFDLTMSFRSMSFSGGLSNNKLLTPLKLKMENSSLFYPSASPFQAGWAHETKHSIEPNPVEQR